MTCPWPGEQLHEMSVDWAARRAAESVECAYKKGRGLICPTRWETGLPTYYNEVVISAPTYLTHLPLSIEAIYASSATEEELRKGVDATVRFHSRAHREAAHAAHARLLEHFALQAADLPLLSMNPFRPAAPFELLVPEGCSP